MNKSILNNLMESIQKGQKALKELPPYEKTFLEKVWDIEHAYYSSALEGSRVDRKEFEKLGKTVA